MLEKFKQKQIFLLWGTIAVLSIALLVILKLFFGEKSVIQKQNVSSKKLLTTGASRINPQEVWVHDFNNKADITQKRLEALEDTLGKFIQLNTAKPTTEEPSLPVTPAGSLKDAIASTVKMDALPRPPQQEGSFSIKNPHQKPSFHSKELKKISLNLNRGRHHKPLKSTDNTIPAGAFAKAILLGGVDASTSIQASSDPRPILLRLTHPGTLPRKFKSDLEGCHVLAASYGDISSERVFMRLEKLSCVERKTGEVMEMNIQGYVAGEDGRAGIRGSVVDRAGENMRNAMVGGFFSSVGKFLGQSNNPFLFSTTSGLAETTPLSTSDILKQSAGNGMSGALDKYADFYIKRAEQMQPVIQVAAGRGVDIVFTTGFDYSDSAMRRTLSKTNDQKRFQQIQHVEETKSVQEWLPKQNGGDE